MAKKRAAASSKGSVVSRRLAGKRPVPRFAIEPSDESRLPVLKTYKVCIGGKFPRSESGRYYLIRNSAGEPLANVCRCSRKDFRDSVVAARAAASGWGSRSAYNRGQILYRIAEMLEGRKAQFIDELVQLGVAPDKASAELALSVDRTLYYAGWCDKYQQMFSSVNPVASSHFNFSVLEPTGVVSVLCPETPALAGLISMVMPIIAGGNVAIALASTRMPLPAVTFAEVLATSDLPGGVVNLLTGERAELLEHFANHMDVNAVVYSGTDTSEIKTVQTLAATNVKRAVIDRTADFFADTAQSPYRIRQTQEVKTTWHPIGT
jgi:acyl-CoA reductase-like NAD-dependent aldehyde dehydrogenase